MTAAKELGSAMRRARRALGLTQGELGQYVGGVDRHVVAAIERGEFTQQVQRLIALLDVLGLELTVRPRSERLASADHDVVASS